MTNVGPQKIIIQEQESATLVLRDQLIDIAVQTGEPVWNDGTKWRRIDASHPMVGIAVVESTTRSGVKNGFIYVGSGYAIFTPDMQLPVFTPGLVYSFDFNTPPGTPLSVSYNTIGTGQQIGVYTSGSIVGGFGGFLLDFGKASGSVARPTISVANQPARLALTSVIVDDLVVQKDTNVLYQLRTLPASVNANWQAIGSASATGIVTVANQPARLALTAVVNDVVVQRDTNTIYQLVTLPTSINANWSIIGQASSGQQIVSIVNQAARLALSASINDLAIQQDNNLFYQLRSLPASTNTNWTIISPASGSVGYTQVANQAARLALTGLAVNDIVYQQDTQSFYVLTALPASTASNWSITKSLKTEIQRININSGLLISGTTYPDYGNPSLPFTSRFIKINVPTGYTTMTIERVKGYLHGDFSPRSTITIDIGQVTGVFIVDNTMTFPNGTNAVDNTSLSLPYVDGNQFGIRVTSAPLGNDISAEIVLYIRYS